MGLCAGGTRVYLLRSCTGLRKSYRVDLKPGESQLLWQGGKESALFNVEGRGVKAILLAAGVGKRMGPGASPKCLLTVGEKSLLRLTLDSLRSVGVRELVLVVGFQKEKVMEEARTWGRGLTLTFIENPRHREGAVLSLWSAREHLNGDCLIMDADVLCPPAAFHRLIRSSHPNALLVDGQALDTGEEQMVLGTGSQVLFITKEPSPELKSRMTVFGESVGFLKLCKESASLLAQLLERKVGEGVVGIEHEQVYPELFARVPVGFEKMEGLPWTEIDTPDDLKRARQEIMPRWSTGMGVNRVMARWFLPVILKTPLSPNQWTCVSLLVGLGSLAFCAQGTRPALLLAAFLFQLFYFVDMWDGEVARARSLSSTWGGWFDLWVDMTVHVLFPIFLAAGLVREGTPSWMMRVAQVAACGLAADFLSTVWAKVKGFGPGVYGDPSRGRNDLSGSKLEQFLRANLTNENFSLLVVAALLLDLRSPFLWALAVGCQFFWIGFLWKSRRRLLTT